MSTSPLRIVLLGKNGMLGSSFLNVLKDNSDVELFAFGHAELEICDYLKLAEVLDDIKPNFVINCIAFTRVDDAEKERDQAFKLNAECVAEMANLCRLVGATLVTFSTDYVFDGENSDGYLENSSPNPLNVYGESKAEGEKLVARTMEKYYIVRTSWLFGPHGKNFVDTMITLGHAETELNVVNDQIGAPTYTVDLAEAVLRNFVFNEDKLDYGIYHLTNSDSCSWYDFAKTIFEIKGMRVMVNPVDSKTFVRPAKRPKYSILRNTKLPTLRSWDEAVEEYLNG
ncbi:MAG: dTDP-4-dehydrorhamnose reductase [Patescibacteria group bacterium]